MNHLLQFTRFSRSSLALAASTLVFAGALTAATVSEADSSAPAKAPPLAVQIDTKPVNRDAMEPASFSKVAKRVAPSVVKITTETKGRTVTLDNSDAFPFNDPMFRQFFGRRGRQLREAPQAGLGSGVIISNDGYIVTNNHVVEGANRLTVSLDDGRELKARVIGRDPQTDVAIIKVDAKGLPSISFAESSKVEVGDRVLAIGNPFGIGETVTTGIVSAKSRRPGLGLAYEDFIQTDAAINPGNSGGALVDIEGRLIGINTAILSRSGGSQGVGLAVPSDIVRNVVDSLVQHGKVVRGYLGVSIQNLTPALAESFGIKPGAGVAVIDVESGSPADKAGLRSGDVISTLNNKTISESSEISLAISQTEPGSKITLEVLRDGKTEKIDTTVGTQPRNRRVNGEEDDSSALSSNNGSDTGVLNGVSVADIDPASRREMNIPAKLRGALITDVAPDSASARAGLKPGDVI
ncbi:MAG: Do family serine endopeptidase, partial [Opitutaceae bacterium]